MTVTAQQLIDRALSRHFSFVNANEGAALAFLNERQRATLLAVIKTAEERLGETSEITVEGTATLVAVDSFGVPFFTTTTQDGYAIRFLGGVPYVDVSDPFVSDPFGITGGVPGLPLPEDMLRLISVSAMTLDNDTVPRQVAVLQQEISRDAPVRVGLRAFISANRLIPIRTDTADIWSRVTSIRLGFVRCSDLTSLSDEITLPSPYLHALTAQLCDFFALQSPRCSEQDKTRFEKKAEAAMIELIDNATSLEGVTSSTVILRR